MELAVSTFNYKCESHFLNVCKKFWNERGFSVDVFEKTKEPLSFIYCNSNSSEYGKIAILLKFKPILDQITSLIKYDTSKTEDYISVLINNTSVDLYEINKTSKKNIYPKNKDAAELLIKEIGAVDIFELCGSTTKKYEDIHCGNSTMSKITQQTFDFIEDAKSSNIFGIYFLYNSDFDLIYVGKSKRIYSRLLTHFNSIKPSYFRIARPKTMSDMNVYEMYFISKLKPLNNCDGLNLDELTIELPDIPHSEVYKVFIEESEFADSETLSIEIEQ